jgi:hypothetical protein
LSKKDSFPGETPPELQVFRESLLGANVVRYGAVVIDAKPSFISRFQDALPVQNSRSNPTSIMPCSVML